MDHLLFKRLMMVVLIVCANRVPMAANASYPALFAFGDSILDTGNNNFIATLSKCNYPPYGRDFYGGIPTGRFCDGKVPSDLIAEALGIKQTLPAFLSGNLSPQDLATGVCFASGGSGLDSVTSTLLQVLSLTQQLGMFRDYIGRLTAVVGQQKASYIVSNGLVLLSAGNNDIGITYSTGRRPMLFPAYASLLVGWTSNFLKDLYALGVRHVWVLSTLPLGCLPGARATVGGLLCNEFANGFAAQFNGMLQQLTNTIRTTSPGYDVEFVDVYTPLLGLARNPFGSGFINSANGCCGGAAVAFGELCTVLTGQCIIPSQYVFWDFAHPTQRAYEIIVSSIIKRHVLQKQNTSSLAPSIPRNLVSH
ncbi:hypothetical protein RIF29_37991 [Crotalaria pallida]|uniref:GDSL esterase/lipase n=1 Tax=Crotalaria pallida TaxID=3830 RepID=A0AAN9E4T0_CROPI